MDIYDIFILLLQAYMERFEVNCLSFKGVAQ